MDNKDKELIERISNGGDIKTEDLRLSDNQKADSLKTSTYSNNGLKFEMSAQEEE